MDSLIAAVDRLEKAVREGVQGKYRRVEGKTVFIRSEDEKVTKGPERLKGKKLVMKSSDGKTSIENMKGALGTPSSEVVLTGAVTEPNKDKDKSKKKRKASETDPSVVNSMQSRLGQIEKSLTLAVERNKAN